MNGTGIAPYGMDIAAKPTAPARGQTANPARATETAREFEAFFVSSMLESMFAGIRTDGYFGGGQGEDVFRSLLLQEYGRTIAQHGGIGIADHVQREMLRLQEDQTR